jgi:PAS domain S-box-containing protein
MADRADRSIHLALLADAIENSPFAVSLFDEHGNYVAVNAKACELTGYTREELIAVGPFGLAVRGEGFARRTFEEALAGERTHGSAKIRRKDGGVVDISYRIGPTRVGGLPFLIRIYWETGS